jgi:hypothetical protein
MSGPDEAITLMKAAVRPGVTIKEFFSRLTTSQPMSGPEKFITWMKPTDRLGVNIREFFFHSNDLLLQ